MSQRIPAQLRRRLTGLFLSVAALSSQAATLEGPAAAQARLQDLLSREALFHYFQGDHLAAITSLQAAHERGLTEDRVADAELLEVRLKLAYGLHEDAERALRRLQDAGLPREQRNLAWFELAQTLYRKGHPEAAGAALERVDGSTAPDFVGQVQLLRAHILLAMERYAAAARALESWQGPEDLAGYAYVNRGIALLGEGKEAEAVRSLKRAARLRADDEERRALRDRANLTLGYVLLRGGDPAQARDHFRKVRQPGPYATRALHAIGLIEQQQGRPEAALAAWNALRGGAPADAAVQEAYLAVPNILREQGEAGALELYEQAVTALSRELQEVTAAQETVAAQDNLGLLLRRAREPEADGATGEETQHAPESRYLGRLLASRRFLETSLGHDDLLAMLGILDEGLNEMDRLAGLSPPASAAGRRRAGTGQGSSAAAGAPHPGRETEAAGRNAGPVPDPRPDEAQEWRGARRPGRPPREIPLLPELDLPPGSELEPLPQPDLSGLPDAPEAIGLPPAPQWLPSEDPGGGDRLPPGPEIVWLPPASRFLDEPADDRDFAYPDLAPEPATRQQPGPGGRRSQPGSAAVSGAADSAAALGDLATVLGQTNERIARIVQALAERGRSQGDLAGRIRALQERARRLRERIAAAIALHERYAKELILTELQQRQVQLEDYLQQARLELAKTYDLETATQR